MATLYSRVKVNTSTTGQGTITLGAAVSGYSTFNAANVADGDTVSYVIEDGSSYEIGHGVYAASTSTLTRDVIQSSNSNNALNLTGSAEVFLSLNHKDVFTQGQSIGLTIALG